MVRQTRTLVRPPPRTFAADRVLRLMSVSLAMASVALLIAHASIELRQASIPSWSEAVRTVVLVLPAIAVFVLFAWASPRTLRRVWGVQAVGLMAAFIGVPIALQGAKLPPYAGATWLSEFSIVAGCAAALAWSTRAALIYAVSLEGVVFGIAVFRGTAPLRSPAMGDAVRQLFFVAMFMTLAMAVTRAGRLLDESITTATREAANAADADMRRTASQTVEMLVHDRLIVAFLAYVSHAPFRTSVDEARAALHAICVSSPSSVLERDPDPKTLAWEMQALCTSLDPHARFDYAIDGDGTIPRAAADALLSAASEALRNSIRHAPAMRAVQRQVHLTASRDRVHAAVLDDGDGFDPGAIGPERFGVQQGIIGRMRSLPGGSAALHSAVGYGTTVRITWRRPG